MKSVPWAKIIRLASFSLLFFVLIYLGYRAYFGIKILLAQGTEFDLRFLMLSLACQVIGYILAAGLWSDIVRNLGVKSGYTFDFLALSVSAIGRKIPGIVIFAIGRLLIYAAVKVSKTLIALGMIIEMIIYAISGIICLLISSADAFPYSWMNNPLVLVLSVIIVIAMMTFLGPQIITFILRISHQQANQASLMELRPLKFPNLFRWIMLGVIVTFFSTGAVFFIFRSIKLETSIPFSPVLASFGLNFLLGPLAVWIPSDIGLRDGIMYFLIKNWTDPSLAALLTLSARVWISLTEIGIGFISAIFLNKRINLLAMFHKKSKPDTIIGYGKD